MKIFEPAATSTEPDADPDALREWQACRRLDHKRILRYIGVCLDGPRAALVAPHFAAGSLHQLLRAERFGLPLLQAVNMCLQVADGVAHMHSRSPPVVHRDLKPANLLLDSRLNVTICDFGLAEVLDGPRLPLCNDGGTPRYMAPEVLDAGGCMTERLDIWAMGCTFIEILGGPEPFEALQTIEEVRRELVVRRCPPTVPGHVPEELRRVIGPCLELAAAARPSAAAVHSQLRAARRRLREAGQLE